MQHLPNHIIAAQALISAWTNWSDEAPSQSDDILQSAVAYTATLLRVTPHQFPDDIRQAFQDAVDVIADDPRAPDLTFDEALEPLQSHILRAAVS